MSYVARIALVATMIAASATLGAPVQQQQNGAPTRAAADPNERICEDVIQTGSRLAKKRFCATRAEWADKRRQDREAIEKAQLSPCVLTHTVVGANGNGHQAC